MKIAFLQFGAAGDMMYATPICYRVRKLYPNDSITWICFDIYRDVIKNNPDIDNYIAWPLVPGQTRQQQEVQRWKEIQEYAYTNFDKVIRTQCWPWDNVPANCLWNDGDDRTIFDHQVLIANSCDQSIGEIEDRYMVFRVSNNDIQKANEFLEKHDLLIPDLKPFICITPYANTVGNKLSPDDYKILSKKYPIIYFGGLNNQEIPWAIDGRGTTFSEMVAIAYYSKGIIGLESGPTYLMSTTMKPLVVLRNPESFPLHKQGLVKCGFRRDDNIKEIIITDHIDKDKMFEDIISFFEG
jgi:ADP-heptose:LPS heptosyltransferase